MLRVARRLTVLGLLGKAVDDSPVGTVGLGEQGGLQFVEVVQLCPVAAVCQHAI